MDSSIPVKVKYLPYIKQISKSTPLVADGTVWKWNYYSGVPQQVMNLKDIKKISISKYSSFAIKKDGIYGRGDTINMESLEIIQTQVAENLLKF